MTKNEARAQALAEAANWIRAAFSDEAVNSGKRLTAAEAKALNEAISIVKYLD